MIIIKPINRVIEGVFIDYCKNEFKRIIKEYKKIDIISYGITNNIFEDLKEKGYYELKISYTIKE